MKLEEPGGSRKYKSGESRLTKTGEAVMEELGIADERDFTEKVKRRRLEALGLVDNFRACGYDYGDNEMKFKALMNECEHAPLALPRAKNADAKEDNSFSPLFYFAAGDETEDQKDYLREFNILCTPGDLLGGNTNDTLDGVKVLNSDSIDNYGKPIKEEDEEVVYDLVNAPWDE